MAPIEELCPEQLFAGGCSTAGCSRKHDARFCDLCSIVCIPARVYSKHITGKPHRARVAVGTTVLLRCPICDVRLTGEGTWIDHVDSDKHILRARNAGVSPQVYPRDPSFPEANHCLVCKRVIPLGSWKAHLRSEAHGRLQRNALFRAKFEQSEKDSRGVTVTLADGGLDFGIVSLPDSERGLQRKVTVTVDAAASSAGFSITQVAAFKGSSNAATPFSARTSHLGRPLVVGRPVDITVSFRYAQRGRYEGRLEINFQDASRGRSFVIARQLRVVVGNAADHELLKPSGGRWVRRGRAAWQQGRNVVEGQRPPAMNAVKWVTKLPPSTIPDGLTTLLDEASTRDALNHIRVRFLPATLNNASHGQHFRILLWIEEARMVEDLHIYDLEGIQFTKDGGLYTLPVPGLAEKRPSVAIGDTILAQKAGTDTRTHQGYVHEVRRDDIRVSFHKLFNGGDRYNVRFQYNRTPIKRQHQALLAPSTFSERLLFPLPGQEGVAQVIDIRASQLTMFNPLIGTNPAQLQAVKSILRLRTGSALFLLVGPPGTGKTVTIVEGIRQILRHQPNAKILACAPSNSAADLIAQRLSVGLTPKEMFRCNAVFRDRRSLPDELLQYSYITANHFALHPVEKLRSFKVIVSTCGNASFPYNIGMPSGHFTYIFVDEAGQASEPEVLTAIKTVANASTFVVLAGDPKQLGPVIRSSIARELGLGKSLMERLMERPLYDSDTGRGRSFVKLVKNFRSHQAIIQYPNERFYDGELEVCGEPGSINAFLRSPQLVSPRFPVVFHHISGENEQESTSPSYFNIDEATEVVEKIKALLADRRHPVRPKDIAVITPYYAQGRKIRLLLRNARVEGMTVGSVEELQGQERPVIIISTVRSSQELLSYDAKFTLGFVANPRRFNVAVTRAKGLLIVVGDSSVLSIDPLWRGFMNYVFMNGGWRGDEPSWDTTVPVDMNFDYAAEIRDAAAAEMDEMMARLGEGEEDMEGQANFERPFHEFD